MRVSTLVSSLQLTDAARAMTRARSGIVASFVAFALPGGSAAEDWAVVVGGGASAQLATALDGVSATNARKQLSLRYLVR